MPDERLGEYERRRSFDRTPEPSGREGAAYGEGRFVIQEHHARRLHWDLRLEHDGVLVSWALPRGLPDDPKRNRLAVHTEDHPIEYLTFTGDIPTGEYGGGSMWIWDTGTFTATEFTDRKVVFELHGERARGRYALFHTRGDRDWLIHRMDPPEPGDPMPTEVAPMRPVEGELPADDDAWAYELDWSGVRTLAFVQPGHVELFDADGTDLSGRFPELVGPLARAIGARRLVLDGELVAFDEQARPSLDRLRDRLEAGTASRARTRSRRTPVTYVITDLLHLDRESLLDRPYAERRELLAELELAGEHWQTPAYQPGDGAAFLEAARELGLAAIVAKRLRGPYRPGVRGPDWRRIRVDADST